MKTLLYLAAMSVVCALCSAGEVGPAPVAPVAPADPSVQQPAQVPQAGEDPKLIATNAQALQDLESVDAATREAAAKVLLQQLVPQIQKLKQPHARKLWEQVSSEQPQARAEGTQKLAAILSNIRTGRPKLLEANLKGLAALDPNLRQRAQEQLLNDILNVLVAQEVDRYIEDLASTDPAVVAAAQKNLTELGELAAGYLVNVLDDERLAVKRGAADILKAIGPAAKDEATALAFMLDNEDKTTRRLVAAVLENLGPDAVDATTDLVDYLRSDEKPVRRVAANILKKIGPGAAKEGGTDLADLLTDDDKGTRALATEVLLNLGPAAKEALVDLITLLEDEGAEADSRQRAAQVLGAIGPEAKDALEALKKHSAGNDTVLKEAAEAAVQKIEK